MTMITKRVGFFSATILLIIVATVLSIRHLAGVEESESQEKRDQSTASSAGTTTKGKPNRLIGEKSPYLLQHAYNPVDWYPWGSEAFERARQENKPIFLSVGYSTCHWCHVMERESFSNSEIAAIMNRHFVNIKVDREERPDVDQVYMAFVQASTGGGGWPMSVFMTPDLSPFFGGTYFPPTRTTGRPGFKKLLLEISRVWESDRQSIVSSASQVVEKLRAFSRVSGDGELNLDKDLLARTYEWYQSNYDSHQGGFGSAPKFPRPVNFSFLLRYHAGTGEIRALDMASHTLSQMSRGGIRDHLGGGFHRYSTDERWFLPHFEKMLYDQAQLTIAYLDTSRITGDLRFSEVARTILDYVLSDMTGKQGGFYSAEDADSSVSHEHPEEHAEGAFYVWSQQEVTKLLGNSAPIFSFFYGVRATGNVERDPFDEFEDKNVLHVTSTLEETAQKFGKPLVEVRELLAEAREKLRLARLNKPRPGLDDKVLTAWNGLMISALAMGYQTLQEHKYLRAAEKAAAFVAETLYDESSGILKRRYRDGDVAVDGLVDDYAFFIQGLLDLYESSTEARWLLLAMDLTETQIRLFWDSEGGGFYSTTGDDPSILIRMKEDYDGAEPSPNSVAILNLLRLSEMTGNRHWRDMAAKGIHAFKRRLKTTPQALPQMMAAVQFYLDKPTQIIIAGRKDSPDTRAMLREVHRRFLPNKIILLADGGPAQKRLERKLEILKSLRQIEGKATAYICENYACKLPTNQVRVVSRLLEEVQALPVSREGS